MKRPFDNSTSDATVAGPEMQPVKLYPWRPLNPLSLPRTAKQTLLFATIGAAVITVIHSQPWGLITWISLISVGMFGEAMRALRDHSSTASSFAQIGDRALSNIIWIGLAVGMGWLFGTGILNLFGIEGALLP